MQNKLNDEKQNNFIDNIQSIINGENKHLLNENLKYINSIIVKDEKQKQKFIDTLISNLILKKKNIYKTDKILLKELQTIVTQNIYTNIHKAYLNNLQKIEQKGYFNYEPLQKLLIEQKFQEADKLTQEYLCKLTKLKKKHERNWLYFTDINLIPSNDLFLIDLLWQIYSKEKFGLYIQRKIWLMNNQKWDTFLEKIGWTKKAIMKKYPEEFEWNIEAPEGHLPLFNQLRGNTVLIQLFKHHVWNEYYT